MPTIGGVSSEPPEDDEHVVHVQLLEGGVEYREMREMQVR